MIVDDVTFGAPRAALAASRWSRPVTTILGVDPDIRRGLAIIAVDDGAAPRLVDAIDQAQRRKNVSMRSRPKQGASKDKEGGRQRALQLFPAQHALLGKILAQVPDL